MCVCLSLSLSCASLIVKSFASCIQQLSGSNQRLSRHTSTHSNPNLVPRCVPKLVSFCAVSHTRLPRWEKTTLKGMKQPRAGIFLIPISHPPLGLGTLRHRNNNLGCQSGGSRQQRMESRGRTLREGGGRFKGMNECGNVELVQESPARLAPRGVNALYRTETLTALLICSAR